MPDATASFSAGKSGVYSILFNNGLGTEMITRLQANDNFAADETTTHPSSDWAMDDTGVFNNTVWSCKAAANFFEIVCQPVLVQYSHSPGGFL